MDEGLFKIVLLVFQVLGIVLTCFIIPYIKEKIGSEKLSKYKKWASYAVQCAEMLFTEHGMGETKKEYVISFLNAMFNKNKIVITKEQIEVLLEACVKEMKLTESN